MRSHARSRTTSDRRSIGSTMAARTAACHRTMFPRRTRPPRTKRPPHTGVRRRRARRPSPSPLRNVRRRGSARTHIRSTVRLPTRQRTVARRTSCNTRAKRITHHTPHTASPASPHIYGGGPPLRMAHLRESPTWAVAPSSAGAPSMPVPSALCRHRHSLGTSPLCIAWNTLTFLSSYA